MLSDLLFELGTEELPSGAVWPLADALANHFSALLLEEKLAHGEVRRFASPRRIAFLIRDVETLQPPQKISRRGPSVAAAMDAEGRPLPALSGFAASCGVPIEALMLSKTDKGAWWVYEAEREGKHLRDLLPSMIRESVSKLVISKPMRWGTGDDLFARPVHWGVLLLGDEEINISLLGIETGRQSFGHRFHHPQAITIQHPRDYESLLHHAYVIADFSKRRATVVEQVQKIAQDQGGEAIMPEALLDEVSSIVEWPQALFIDFERKFLNVPPEALIAAMQVHQKCFAMRSSDGQLLPHFISVANIESSDVVKVVQGNERVMQARLSDAAFFYQQDRQHSLHHHYAATEKVVFQAKLGTLQQKSQRLKTLMIYLAPQFDCPHKDAIRAAELSKCDLMTGMVGEFPELQGIMGYYYASHDGEASLVALALKEQYMPRFSADALPSSPLGVALSLADRLDTLVGSFALGQKPSGVKDPFKLRRHALAVVRLLIATPKLLDLSTLINLSLEAYSATISSVHAQWMDLKPFILDRLTSYYQTQGVSSNVIQAVLACQDECLFDLDRRVQALLAFSHLSEANALSAACKRVGNILQKATVDDTQTIDSHLFETEVERSLFEYIEQFEKQSMSLYEEGRYKDVLVHVARLREPVDNFFEQVMVMVEDPILRDNRLRLLMRLQRLLKSVADISLLSL